MLYSILAFVVGVHRCLLHVRDQEKDIQYHLLHGSIEVIVSFCLDDFPRYDSNVMAGFLQFSRQVFQALSFMGKFMFLRVVLKWQWECKNRSEQVLKAVRG
ncbi:CLUMA_CG005873, isoform A [Clunio marinus]|uniref:CLUMA_CG005873, isoform A n=1 Tax=Clunio marinus TaxID=568069 RepID=A0A1J1I1P6_9DIPT|nr:CLUMA_CG005873, isoform A [Clunio marinus]